VCLQKQDKTMLELAKQLIDCNSLMFFARGNNYATALEAALKVRIFMFNIGCQ
jgi:glucosamine--fructose-6-phosphate aminotransferase (isomerizing)